LNIITLRNWSFWVADCLTGGSVKRHLLEVSDILSDATSEASLEKQGENLEALLQHATSTTSYYSSFKDYQNLDDFPVIMKTDVQKSFDAFRSTLFTNKKLYKVATSGSTGVPFFLFQNIDKRRRNIADVYYFLKKVDHILGQRLYELEIWQDHNRKSKLKSWIQNVVQFDVTKLTPDRMDRFLTDVKKYPMKKSFLGFASSLETICKYLDRDTQPRVLPIINTIIANSEFLNKYTRERLKVHFKANVYSRYSNEEVGIIAHQTAHSNDEFTINWASYFVELLDMDSDIPAAPRDLGRIVVTDLFNYSMPLIRYDTGDVGIFTETNTARPNFKYIEGRKMDLIYDTQGNILSSFIVYTKLYKYYKDLKQYQFIQTGEREYTINLNVIDTFNHEQDLIKDIQSDFGQDAMVTINYVEEIPPLASGKRKKVVNLYHKN